MDRSADSPVAFDGDGPPRSRLYDDIYFSREDGLAESRTVFLTGAGLPHRWAGRRRFTVAELGFGAGLNVIALLDLWRETRPDDGHLSIFSVEAHPMSAATAAKALAGWPELAPVADLVLSRWPGLRRGVHRLDLPELSATLDVAVTEADRGLADWNGRADAWFLDGFAPARNPAMWTDALMRQVAERSASGAVAATYTVAGQVRRGLAAAGFAVERRPGFGRKRERLEARWPEPVRAERRPPTIAIVGAGVAGAALARAFRALGAAARLFEADRPGAGASGNPAAVVTPRLDAGLGPSARLHAEAFARAVRLYEATPRAVLSRGVLQLQTEARDEARHAKIAASDLFEPDELLRLHAEEVSARLGEAAPAGLDLRCALVVDPAAVLAAWAPRVERARVAAIEPRLQGWRLVGPGGEIVAEPDVVCLAVGSALPSLWPQIAVTPVRGQVSWAPGASGPAVGWGAYVAPARDGLAFGATHDREETAADARDEDNQRNLAAIAERLPNLCARLDHGGIVGRASVRASTHDHLPLAGAGAPGLMLLGGLGGRGFTLAPLLAEHLAAMVLGTPSPLPASLARLVDPGRFEERARRRKGLSERGAPA